MSQSKRLEKIFKGVSNHRRIDILLLIKENSGINLDSIAKRLECNIKTISEHTRRLTIAGLIHKKYSGKSVLHFLSPHGKRVSHMLSLL